MSRPEDVVRLAYRHLGDAAPAWLGLLRPGLRLVAEWDAPWPVVARIGGLPVLPEEMPWPRGEGGEPLPYVAELDCAALGGYELDVALPRDGRLVFFGADPYEGGEGWHVAHVAGGVPREAEGATFGERRCGALPVATFPTPPFEHPAWAGFARDEAFADALYEQFGSPWHQAGGYPLALQGPVEREGWTCLLQVDTDDDLDLMWGDGGTAYWLASGDRHAFVVQSS